MADREPLRAFLDRREKELADEIATLHRQLAPMEWELSEVRRAKGALGIEASTAFHGTGTLTISEHPSGPVPAAIAGKGVGFATIVTGTLRGAAPTGTAETIAAPPNLLTSFLSSHKRLTMKQLVVKALMEHFERGATAKQLREFFRDAWGRDIERPNLSPQLSRLRADGVIELMPDTHVWRLTAKAFEQTFRMTDLTHDDPPAGDEGDIPDE